MFRLLCPITLESEKSLIPNYSPALDEFFLEQNTASPKETLMLSEPSDIIGEEKNTDNKSEVAQGILGTNYFKRNRGDTRSFPSK